MKRRLRLRQILDLLQTLPELSVEEVCERLQASPATVRRDFVHLAKEGRVGKTWGGIRALAPGSAQLSPPAFAARLDQQKAEKKAIAQAAAGLLTEGDVVMIDGGTTTFQLAEFIARKRIRVITNSLVIAQAIDQFRGSFGGAEIHLTGGQLQPESGVLAGPQAEAFIQQYRANWVFLSAAGVDASAVTNYNESVLTSEKLMIEQSAQVALLVDHSKLGRQAMCVLCPLEKVDVLISGAAPGQDGLLRSMEERVIRVMTVPLAPEDGLGA